MIQIRQLPFWLYTHARMIAAFLWIDHMCLNRKQKNNSSHQHDQKTKGSQKDKELMGNEPYEAGSGSLVADYGADHKTYHRT